MDIHAHKQKHPPPNFHTRTYVDNVGRQAEAALPLGPLDQVSENGAERATGELMRAVIDRGHPIPNLANILQTLRLLNRLPLQALQEATLLASERYPHLAQTL